MQTHRVDVAILGAGTAGLTARRSAQKAGARVLLIDPGPLGTTCARVGCMPSKLLIAAAEAAHRARAASLFGIQTQVVVNGAAVMERVRKERDRFVQGVVEPLSNLGPDLISAKAMFVDPHTIEAEGHRIEAKAIVIATGSRNFVPPPFRKLHPAVVLNNLTIFELENLPRSMLVVGTGVIALELGQALQRLGVTVTLVGIDGRVGPFRDKVMQDEARRVLSAELDLHPSYDLRRLEQTDQGVDIEFADPDGSHHRRVVDKVLLAAGRVPNLSDLGLERAGIALDPRGMPSFEPTTGRIGDSHIFMAGDVTDFRPVLHEAADSGHVAGENAARFPQVLVRPRRTLLQIVFTDPNMAVVGESPFSQPNRDTRSSGELDFSTQGRARVMGQNHGRLRLYGDRTSGSITGAEMFGPQVEHTAHLVAWAIQGRLTVEEVLAMPFYHPVIEEGLRTALVSLLTKMHMAPAPGAECEEFGPGA